MSYVRAKKNLGQHFLTDKNIAQKIVDKLGTDCTKNVLEIGPGTGVLTQFLIDNPELSLKAIEIDRESVEYLSENYSKLKENIIEANFLKYDLPSLFNDEFSVIGNFPYNISSQIFFKILEHRSLIPEVVGMIQKEVAERICSPHGSKTYGILSVLLQAYYDIEYLFTVHENVFLPPPKVKSAVVRMVRKKEIQLDCDERLFFQVVKTAFNQRRKMLRNSLKNISESVPEKFAMLRPEQMSIEMFIELSKLLQN